MSAQILVVTLPLTGEPRVFWTSAEYVVAAATPLGSKASLDEAWPAFAALQGGARRFASRAEAAAWAESYDEPHWLQIRAEIATLPVDPPGY